ncbi:MAG: D-TA family PLP-dependent enzyme [Ginsengibacter sp.]
MSEWYPIKDIDSVDSPALIIYPDRVKDNIREVISMIDEVQRLRPHVKTHKTREASVLMMDSGITRFKCATIAEAEMLGMVNAPDVLLAYQPVGPKLKRFVELIKKYPSTKFSCLVDNLVAAESISGIAVEQGLEITVYIDLNVGMKRTGIEPGENAIKLYESLSQLRGVQVSGLHAYDGHIRAADLRTRTAECDAAFEPVKVMQQKLIDKGFGVPVIIAGGSPTYPIHAKRLDIECSPGTFIYWDKGYHDLCAEQNFSFAALVISRIISLPGETRLCLDLGHKSISAENDLAHRIYFLNAPELKFISQSEEHLVAETGAGHSYKVGDVLYGVPFHICPTCALYERAITVENNEITNEWKIIARDRKINI